MIFLAVRFNFCSKNGLLESELQVTPTLKPCCKLSKTVHKMKFQPCIMSVLLFKEIVEEDIIIVLYLTTQYGRTPEYDKEYVHEYNNTFMSTTFHLGSDGCSCKIL